MAAIRLLEFLKFRVYVTQPLWPYYYASLCKVTLISNNRLLSYGQKMIFEMAGIVTLNL